MGLDATVGDARSAADPATGAAPAQHRSGLARIALIGAALLAFALFVALGTWQVERRSWKLALIEHTEQRVHAPTTPAPGIERWPMVSAASDEYRHVHLEGRFLHDKETLVQASTELGSGYWVLTPLQGADGTVVLVNRGFVPSADRGTRDAAPQAPTSTVTGLLRISEPGGGFLRSNDPAQGRWYSRDVQAIAAARGLDHVAPYFVDADAATERQPGEPVGGLTVIAFHNNHLSYAITWYALALMVVGAGWYVRREALHLADPDDDDERRV